MLSLKTPTPARWLAQVDEHLSEVLIDHAHCEKKAAATAMNLIFAYVEDVPLVVALGQIVEEELLHFRQVLELLQRRGIPFCRLKPAAYGQQLHDLIRKQEPGRAIDRFLIAGLIEARSCERFDLLRSHIRERELADFYGSLFESEARHHATYVQFARQFGDAAEVQQRLSELAAAEAEIIERGNPLPRMHS
jgi:tRNA-(ms[2]io[6]A)-hydroxylase